MEPLPETREALEELAEYDDHQLEATLHAMGQRAKEIAPECVGLSLSTVEDGLTFTLVATEDEWAVLDAIQYLDGGPCVTAADTAEVIDLGQIDPLDEDRWSMYARASAASGVASSLSLPILRQGRVVGGVNLYGATPGAFRGRHDELAAALTASPGGAVTDADLEFRTRDKAAEATDRLDELQHIDLAVGIIAAGQGVDTTTALARLRQAAMRAGITEAQVAQAVRHLHGL